MHPFVTAPKWFITNTSKSQIFAYAAGMCTTGFSLLKLNHNFSSSKHKRMSTWHPKSARINSQQFSNWPSHGFPTGKREKWFSTISENNIPLSIGGAWTKTCMVVTPPGTSHNGLLHSPNVLLFSRILPALIIFTSFTVLGPFSFSDQKECWMRINKSSIVAPSEMNYKLHNERQLNTQCPNCLSRWKDQFRLKIKGTTYLAFVWNFAGQD